MCCSLLTRLVSQLFLICVSANLNWLSLDRCLVPVWLRHFFFWGLLRHRVPLGLFHWQSSKKLEIKSLVSWGLKETVLKIKRIRENHMPLRGLHKLSPQCVFLTNQSTIFVSCFVRLNNGASDVLGVYWAAVLISAVHVIFKQTARSVLYYQQLIVKLALIHYVFPHLHKGGLSKVV